MADFKPRYRVDFNELEPGVVEAYQKAIKTMEENPSNFEFMSQLLSAHSSIIKSSPGDGRDIEWRTQVINAYSNLLDAFMMFEDAYNLTEVCRVLSDNEFKNVDDLERYLSDRISGENLMRRIEESRR